MFITSMDNAKKFKAAGVLDMPDGPILKLPPEGEVLPPGHISFNTSEMNRKERRRYKKRGIHIVGTNKPFVKEK